MNQQSPCLKNLIDQYDHFQNPPDILKAVLHKKATMVGISSPNPSHFLCPCCFRAVDKKPLDLGCHINQLSFLGTGITMYFKLVKVGIVLLTILFSFLIVVWYILGEKYCKQQCSNSLGTDIKRYSQMERQNLDQALIISLIGSILIFVIVIITKKVYDSLIEQAEKINKSPSSYSVLISGLPKNVRQDDLKTWTNDKFGQYPVQVILATDVKELQEAFASREELTIFMHKNRIQSKGNVNFSLSVEYSLEKGLLDKKQKQILEQIKKKDAILSKYNNFRKIVPYQKTGVALLIFQTSISPQKIIKKYSQNEFQFLKKAIFSEHSTLEYKSNEVTVEEGPAPKDIIWSNLSPKNIKYELLLSLGAVFILFGILTVSLIILVNFSHYYFQKNMKFQPFIFIVIGIYYIFDIIIYLFISFYLKGKQYYTGTQYESNHMLFYGYFNILFVCLIPYSLYYPNQEYLLFTISSLMFFNAFSDPLIRILNIKNLYQTVFSEYIIGLPSNKNPYTQDYLKRKVQGRQFNLGHNYHYLIRSIFVPTFYGHAILFGFFFYIVSLTLSYWISKYLLLRKCKEPLKCSRMIADRFFSTLSLLPVTYILGIIQFQKNVTNQSTQQMISFLALIVAVKAASTLLLYQFSKNKTTSGPTESYSSSLSSFSQLYELENEIIFYNGECQYLRQNFGKADNSLIHSSFLDGEDFVSLQKNFSATLPVLSQKQKRKLINKMLSLSIQLRQISVSSHNPK